MDASIVASGQPASLDFDLAVAGLHQEVSVIATDYPQVPTEIAKSVSLISAEELERRDTVFLTDALTAVPGLQLQQLGGPGSVASYRFRGLLPEDTAVLLDGFRFTDPSDNRARRAHCFRICWWWEPTASKCCAERARPSMGPVPSEG